MTGQRGGRYDPQPVTRSSECYGDMGPETYWGHDLDLLGSRDVIEHFPFNGQ